VLGDDETHFYIHVSLSPVCFLEVGARNERSMVSRVIVINTQKKSVKLTCQ
jgi:hypothetical protein